MCSYMVIGCLGKFFWKKEGSWLNLQVIMAGVAVVTFLVLLTVLAWPIFPHLLVFSRWAKPRMISPRYDSTMPCSQL